MNRPVFNRALNDFDVYRLKNMPLFAGIDGLDKSVFLRLGARLESYVKGQVVCRQGDPFPYVAFLLTGEVEAGFTGSSYYQMIDRFRAGETFAEAVAVKDLKSPVDIRATAASEVVLLNCDVLLHSPNDPVICEILSRVTVEITNKMTVLINKVHTLRNPVIVGRVAGMLLELKPNQDGCVDVGFSQSELGTYLGSSRSRVSGALAVLVNDGLVEQVESRHGIYRILDRRGLEYTAFNGKVPLTDGAGAADAAADEPAAPSAAAGDAVADKTDKTDKTADGVNIDSTRTMRAIVGDEPLFEAFLQYKGFPFSVDNPITEIVTFDDVVSMQHLDKDAFLAEYAAWKRSQAARPAQG